MKLLIQQVSRALVRVESTIVGKIDHGLLVYVGFGRSDTAITVSKAARKLARLRAMRDKKRDEHVTVKEVDGSILLVSQFTLYGDLAKGTRPSFTEAMSADLARDLYASFVEQVRELSGVKVETGAFQAQMEVESVNKGPINLLWESN